MTDKPIIIETILLQMREQGITLSDLAQAMDNDPAPPSPPSAASDIAMRVFAYLGGIFILAGLSTYIAMFWNTMPSFMRILVTLGTGLGLSFISILAMKEGKYPRLIMPLVLIAACIETIGWSVLVNELFPHAGDTLKAAAVAYGIMALQQSIVFHIFRRTELILTAIIAAYAFFTVSLQLLDVKEEYIAILLGGCLVFTTYVISRTPHRLLCPLGYIVGACWFNAGLYEYLARIANAHSAEIAVGVSFCSLAYGLREVKNSRLSELAFLLGSVFFYYGLFEALRHTRIELLYLAVAIGMLYGSVLLQSRAILLTASLAILGFIGYYTSEYFVRSVGWPVALILMGTAFFGISAMAVKIKRTYRL